jgi:hypothetical protein
MKKIVLVLLLLTLSLSLFACTGTGGSNNSDTPGAPANTNNNAPGEIIMENLYFFRPHNGRSFSINDGSPVKINPVSKTVTFVCLDPLCDHNVDCPFFQSLWGYHVTGNYMFFMQFDRNFDESINDWDAWRYLCVYDMLSGITRKLTEYRDNLNIIGVVENYLYYYTFRESEETGDTEFVLHRADAVSGNIIDIDKPSLDGSAAKWISAPAISKIADGKIYWSELDSENQRRIYYTTNLEGKNKELIDLKIEIGEGADQTSLHLFYATITDNNGYSYFKAEALYNRVPSDEELANRRARNYEGERSRRNRNLYRALSDGSREAELLAESVIHFVMHGDKIYFMALQDDTEIIEYGNGSQTWNWSGGKVYVMNSDGSDRRLLADTGYNLSDPNTMMNKFFEVKTINGVDYIGLTHTIVLEHPPSPFSSQPSWTLDISSDTIIINASTGEWVVLEMPE